MIEGDKKLVDFFSGDVLVDKDCKGSLKGIIYGTDTLNTKPSCISAAVGGKDCKGLLKGINYGTDTLNTKPYCISGPVGAEIRRGPDGIWHEIYIVIKKNYENYNRNS